MKDFHSLSQEEQNKHRVANGGFNDFPPGWREVSMEDFAQSDYFTWNPKFEEFRQMLNPEQRNEPAVSARLWWMHDNTGYALVQDYWGKKVKFFKFGCKHAYETGEALEKELSNRNIKLGQHDHALFCVKCKSLTIIDSSG